MNPVGKHEHRYTRFISVWADESIGALLGCDANMRCISTPVIRFTKNKRKPPAGWDQARFDEVKALSTDDELRSHVSDRIFGLIEKHGPVLPVQEMELALLPATYTEAALAV